MPLDVSWLMSDDELSKIKIIPDAEEQLQNYIINPKLPMHDPQPYILPRIPDLTRLYHVPNRPPATTLYPERDPITGEVIDFIELSIPDAECTAKNSSAITRAPGPAKHAIRGAGANYPFWPGGFEERTIDETERTEPIVITDIDFEQNLLTIPPGFDRGIDFSTPVATGEESVGVVDLLASLKTTDDEVLELFRDDDKVPDELSNEPVDELIAVPRLENSILKISEINNQTTVKNLQWAEMIDVTKPVIDFHLKVPDPAHKYPFELDVFQKQAIIKLEEHNHVLVAAHTSAGKTVVAEYAVALSRKHMTRTIYTSPIKALSNQKYRDFKQQFKDVGLITGDIQIDPTSSCLVMTTEILCSMLYCGSEVTRDIEYVIFDEVHYINDADRGHVWEEVLILLPDHVNIVMLSATVPNTMEFANWVGQTKQRKVYVISTLKRPVPLMHYLYTGHGGRTKNDIFLLVDENGVFSTKGYWAAKESLEKRGKNLKPVGGGSTSSKVGKPPPHLKDVKHKPSYKQKHESDPAKQQVMWNGLIDHLKTNNKLPVVAFTLSRNRCDSNVRALQSCDLCTGEESGQTHMFFQKCLQKLKPEDRIIPQVLTLQDSLKRGIGVHHSGILPILREIVEMLFQRGLVKLLFATETFAMGVNMPARTVIFDSHRKFDGTGVRNLRAAEYIQMAGRAGRRGLDDNGTVILLCKSDVPIESELQAMILGKPMKLESQFRLTYGTILNLHRVDSVTVEQMMAHSFREFHAQQLVPENLKRLKKAEQQIRDLPELGELLQPLCEFYDAAKEYIDSWHSFMVVYVNQQKIAKELKPGCIVIVTQGTHLNKIGIVLASSFSREPSLKVLVLDNQSTARTNPSNPLLVPSESQNPLGCDELWSNMISLLPGHDHYQPDGIGGHTILTISAKNLVEITGHQIKVDGDKIIQNWQQRQIPRFMDQPPGPTVINTVNDLSELNNKVIAGTVKLQSIEPKIEMDLQLHQIQMKSLRSKVNRIISTMGLSSNIEMEFSEVYKRKRLEANRDELKFKVSKQNLSLYSNYQMKLSILKALRYIDDQEQVTMKGRVACGISTCELIITELILSNVFTNLESAQIAALLSSLVCQTKNKDDDVPKFVECMEESIATIKAIDQRIVDVEQQHKELENDRLNFSLVNVIYEWGQNKPFAEIMKLTEIQEGIIVRCIQQLHELLLDVKDAARIIGNPALQQKMEDASNAIKRDIVFTASLYFDK